MADNAVETTVLLLTSGEGEMYAIPQDALEQYRVTDEQRAQLEQQIGAEVTGYNMDWYQVQLILETERYQRAEQTRREADYERTEDDDYAARTPAVRVAEPQGLRRAFTSLLTTLRLAPAQVPKDE